MRKTLNEFGIKFGIIALVITIFDVLTSNCNKWFPTLSDCLGSYIGIIATVLSVYVIGFPLLYILTKNMPGKTIEKKSLTFKQFMYFVLLLYGCNYVGTLVGLPIHIILSIPSKMRGMAGLFSVLFAKNPIASILVASVCAPIFEELMCRKILVSKIAVHNEYLAIITSGLCFGILHGNFQQAGFTFFIGCFFAYIYLRTGKIKYTMMLHATMNGVTTLITAPLVRKALSVIPELNISEIIKRGNAIMELQEAFSQLTEAQLEQMIPWILAVDAFSMILSGVMIVGTVFLIIARVKKKIALPPEEKEKVGSKKENIKALLTAPGMWFFYAVGTFRFLQCYLFPIFK